MYCTPSSFLFLSNNYFRIPYFQRPYVWRDEQWQKPIESLSSDEDYFIGSIIIKSEKQGYSIIDGQQRMTTICILLRACLDIINESDYTNAINNILFHSEATGIPAKIEKDKITLKVNHAIEDDFNKIMMGKIDLPPKDRAFKYNEKLSPAINCYNYFCGKIENEDLNSDELVDVITKEKAYKIYNVLLKRDVDQNNNREACIIRIDLNANENEQKIFNTINAEGVKLTTVDIIKNNLFYKYRDLLKKEGKDENIAFSDYNLYWRVIFEEKNVIKFWEREITTLFGYIGVIFKFFDRNRKEHKDDILHKIYDAYIDSINDSDELRRFIESILNFALIYKQLIKNNEDKLNWTNKERLTGFILDNTGTNTLTPYLLETYKRYCKWVNIESIDEDTQVEITDYKNLWNELEIISSVALRFCISYNTGKKIKNFNKKISTVIGKDIDGLVSTIIKDDKGNDADISDDNFKKGLTNNLDNKNGKLVLYLIELYKRSTDITSPSLEINDIDKYSLEHIIPQEYETYWGVLKHPVYIIDNEVEKKIDDEIIAKDIRNKKIYEIGNMLLLTGSQNSSQSNKYINYKVECKNDIMSGKRKERWSSYETCNDLSITHEVVKMYRDNVGKRVPNELWDERDIEQRSKELTKLLIKLFPVK